MQCIKNPTAPCASANPRQGRSHYVGDRCPCRCQPGVSQCSTGHSKVPEASGKRCSEPAHVMETTGHQARGKRWPCPLGWGQRLTVKSPGGCSQPPQSHWVPRLPRPHAHFGGLKVANQGVRGTHLQNREGGWWAGGRASCSQGRKARGAWGPGSRKPFQAPEHGARPGTGLGFKWCSLPLDVVRAGRGPLQGTGQDTCSQSHVTTCKETPLLNSVLSIEL